MTTTPLETATRPLLGHAHHADAPAVLGDGIALTHSALADRVALRAASWGPARRLVLVEAANTLDALIAYLAAIQHGHVALVVPSDRAAQTDALIDSYDPDVVCGREGDVVRREATAHDLHPDLALLLSTSGSTGSPKLVRLSRDNVVSNATAIADYLDLTPADRAITALPLHYCYGLSVLHSHLVAGASIVLTDLSVVDECFWDLFNRAGATGFAGVPHTFDLLEATAFAARDLPSLRLVTQAGGRLAPEVVRRWAGLGRERGWDLVVMYGQTEATARMAWLPPDLAERHPDAIGQAIPGGQLRLDTSVDERVGVGELIYEGPNVMLGYAESPADLGRGRDVHALRTGDLARQVEGSGEHALFEVVGRRNRYGKVFGLRLDLDALERTLDEDLGSQTRIVATDRTVDVFLTLPRQAARARALIAEACAIPDHAVRSHVLAHLPSTSNGKPDYAALATLAALEDDTPHNDGVAATKSSRPIRDDFARVLGRPAIADSDSFVALGGDSLSYVELATRLSAHFPDGVPTGWHTMSLEQLEGTAAARTVNTDDAVRRPRGVRLDTTVGLRALAILFVVASHVDLVHLEGGAHLLLALAGFNFARFQLSSPGGVGLRLRHGLAGVSQLLVPSVLWIGAIAVLFGTYDLTTTLFVREFLNSSTWDDQWQFWFLESLVWITLAALVVTCVPALYGLERRWPFRFALVVVGLTALMRFAEVGLRAGPTQRYTTLVVAFFFALGWLGARASTRRERLLVTGVAIALIAGYFGQPHREVIVLGGFLLMLWLPQVSLPVPVARVCGVLAGASLFIYLTHWQVYPPLEDAGHPWLALVASITLGILYGRVVRPLHQAVGRAVLGAR